MNNIFEGEIVTEILETINAERDMNQSKRDDIFDLIFGTLEAAPVRRPYESTETFYLRYEAWLQMREQTLEGYHNA